MGGEGGQLVVDVVRGGLVGLVDMDAADGAADSAGDGGVVGGAADDMVEDEDFGGTGARACMRSRWGIRSEG